MIPAITPEQVAAGFAKYGIEPVRGETFAHSDGAIIGCALPVLAAERGWDYKAAHEDAYDDANDPWVFLYENLHEWSWVDGITAGFDGEECLRGVSPEFRSGYEFGKRVSALVFGEEEANDS